jgi:ribulose-5-phosphate 4-epimerase/fuculose-1-phosphate aldolase
MRGHGMTCVGASIEEAVHRAVYTCANARLQTQALLMQGTFNAGLVARHSAAGKDGAASEPARQVDLKYLSPRECQDSWAALGKHTQRPWEMWCAEVRCSPLYRNELDGGEV